MEDYMNYISALNETGGIMNQVASAREMVDQQIEEKKQEYGIPSEMIAETAGIYLGKKALGLVADKFGGEIADAASKVGISAETTAKALSGDLSGAAEGAVADIQANVGGLISSGVEQATSVVSGLVGEGSTALSGLVSDATGVVGSLASNVSNVIGTINPINIEESANALYEGTMSDLAAQSQMELGALRNFTNVSLQNMGRNVANDTSNVGDVELTDFSTVGSDIGTAASSGVESGAIAAEAGTTAAETGTAIAETGATVGEAVAAGGLEAAAAGLSATGVLAPLAGLLGLIGGIVGIFEEHKSAPAPIIPVLNPSAQYL